MSSDNTDGLVFLFPGLPILDQRPNNWEEGSQHYQDSIPKECPQMETGCSPALLGFHV